LSEKSKKNKIVVGLVTVVAVVAIIVGIFMYFKFNVSKPLAIFDGVAEVSFSQKVLDTMKEGLDEARPGYVLQGETMMYMASAGSKAVTRLNAVNAWGFTEPESIGDVLRAQEIMGTISKIDQEVINRTENRIEMSAYVTNDNAKNIKTHYYDVVIEKGTNYTIVAITQVREENMDDSVTKDWISYMKTLKIVNDTQTFMKGTGIIGKPLIDFEGIRKEQQKLRIDDVQFEVKVPEAFNITASADTYYGLYDGANRNGLYVYAEEYTAEVFIDTESADVYVDGCRGEMLVFEEYRTDIQDLNVSEIKTFTTENGHEFKYVVTTYKTSYKLSDDVEVEMLITEIASATQIRDGVSYMVYAIYRETPDAADFLDPKAAIEIMTEFSEVKYTQPAEDNVKNLRDDIGNTEGETEDYVDGEESDEYVDNIENTENSNVQQ